MSPVRSRFFAVAARFQALASLTLSGVTVVDRGRIVDGAVVDMSGADIEIAVDLGLGACEAVAWGCDLTCEYVRINAEKTGGRNETWIAAPTTSPRTELRGIRWARFSYPQPF